ncbi:MAG: MFS transporter [Anaerolineales bacterium]|nr:MFS transporter [Anaerolineales bacterium]
MEQPSLPVHQNKLWSIDFVLTLLSTHFLFVSYGSLITILPLYVLELSGHEWHIGIVVGSFGIVALGVRPFAGRWVYILGAKRIALIGFIIFGTASILHIYAQTFWWLLAVRALQGTGMAMAPVATATMVANLAPSVRRAEGMAYEGNATAGSSIYAPLVAFWILTQYGFVASFLFSASASLVAFILALRISSAKTNLHHNTIDNYKISLINRKALFPTTIFLGYTVTWGAIGTFLPLLAEERQLGNPGLYFTVAASTIILTMFVAGLVADRVGRAAVIIPGLLATALGMFTLAYSTNQFMFLVSSFTWGIGFGLLSPGLRSLTVDRVIPRERSSAIATLQQGWDVGGSGGAFILAPTTGIFNVATPFIIAGIITVTSTVGFFIGNKKYPSTLPKNEISPK